MQKQSSLKWLALGSSVLVGVVGLKMGYDFGQRISGVFMGIVLGINTGLIGALLTSALVDRMGRLVGVLSDTNASSKRP